MDKEKEDVHFKANSKRLSVVYSRLQAFKIDFIVLYQYFRLLSNHKSLTGMKTCLHCSEPIRGRSDKKFCDPSCRNAYNNERNKDESQIMRNVNRILRKNRKILSELNPNGKAKVSQSELTSKGFDFNYFTNTYTTRKGGVYHFIYEHGWIRLDDGKFALVIKQDWLS